MSRLPWWGDVVRNRRGKWYCKGRWLPWYVSFSQVWSKSGRDTKRKLSKTRRQAWKDERHQRGLAGIESTCNWKDW